MPSVNIYITFGFLNLNISYEEMFKVRMTIPIWDINSYCMSGGLLRNGRKVKKYLA